MLQSSRGLGGVVLGDVLGKVLRCRAAEGCLSVNSVCMGAAGWGTARGERPFQGHWGKWTFTARPWGKGVWAAKCWGPASMRGGSVVCFGVMMAL